MSELLRSETQKQASSAYDASIETNAKVLSNLNPGITVHDAKVFNVAANLFSLETWHARIKDKDASVLVALTAAPEKADKIRR